MYKYIFLILLLIFTGCSNKVRTLDGKIIKENNIKEEEISSRDYKDFSKDLILNAAKKVFTLAGKNHFRIDSYRDKLLVSKTKMKYIPLLVLAQDDYWELSIQQNDNITKASLVISRVTNHDFDNTLYFDKEDHELFWNRLDYLLGLNTIWKDCTRYWESNGILCDKIDLTNYKEPTKDDIFVSEKEENRITLEEKIEDDILKEDIDLTLDENRDDILSEQKIQEEEIDEDLDKVIEDLDRRVNESIDSTLDEIRDDVNE